MCDDVCESVRISTEMTVHLNFLLPLTIFIVWIHILVKGVILILLKELSNQEESFSNIIV